MSAGAKLKYVNGVRRSRRTGLWLHSEAAEAVLGTHPTVHPGLSHLSPLHPRLDFSPLELHSQRRGQGSPACATLTHTDAALTCPNVPRAPTQVPLSTPPRAPLALTWPLRGPPPHTPRPPDNTHSHPRTSVHMHFLTHSQQARPFELSHVPAYMLTQCGCPCV